MNKSLTAILMMFTLAAMPDSAADLTCPTASPSHDWQGFQNPV